MAVFITLLVEDFLYALFSIAFFWLLLSTQVEFSLNQSLTFHLSLLGNHPDNPLMYSPRDHQALSQ
jgi:hypothetical protein